jgi:sterol desaturase/sphingolipid hydroxylase (fatty acid hydroxylase superfamily)
MVFSFHGVSDLAQLIGMAVAPVFLLAGIAGFLNVMSARLGRIIDRARIVEVRVSRVSGEQRTISEREMVSLWRRVDIIHLSIALCAGAGLLVCALIAALFIAALWQLSADGLIVGLFVLALVLLIFSLLCLLNEIRLATRSLRAGFEYAEERSS